MNTGREEAAFHVMKLLRSRGVRTELFHEDQKVDRQYKYAERKNIPFVVTVNAEGSFQIKDIRSGEVKVVPSPEELLAFDFS